MVFLTSIIIVCIYYFMQERGLIFITVVALSAEVMNISMTRIMSKSVEKKLTAKYTTIVDRHAAKIDQMKKRNIILESQREDDTNALYDAREKNKALEEKVKEYEELTIKLQERVQAQQAGLDKFEDLPTGSGSNKESA